MKRPNQCNGRPFGRIPFSQDFHVHQSFLASPGLLKLHLFPLFFNGLFYSRNSRIFRSLFWSNICARLYLSNCWENPLNLSKTSKTNPIKLIQENSQFYQGIDANLSDRCPMLSQPHWIPDIPKKGRKK